MYANKSIKIILLLLVSALILTTITLFLSCSTEPIPEKPAGSLGQEETSSQVFDARQANPGDKIGSLTIEEINIEDNPNSSNQYYATVKFSGNLQLSGKYISYSDQPLWGKAIIFYPDQESQQLLPKLDQDPSGPEGLLLENYEEAAELLSPPDSEGQAEIIIENYTINYALEVAYTAHITEASNLEITAAPGKDFSQKIVFSSSTGSQSSIYICNPDGSGLEAIMEGGIFTSPSWNQDHSRIVYTVINPEDGTSSLYIYDVENRSQTLLLQRYSPAYPSFSPDGNRIIFSDLIDELSESREIYSINADGTGLVRLTNDKEENFFAKYSPDGNFILFSAENASGIQLYLMDSQGGNIEQVTDDAYTNNHGIFSPDGSTLLFESNRDGNIELYQAKLENMDEFINITNNGADNFEASFSPDGTQVVFRSNKDSSDPLIYDIFVMSADGSNQVNITSSLEGSSEFNPCWSW